MDSQFNLYIVQLCPKMWPEGDSHK